MRLFWPTLLAAVIVALTVTFTARPAAPPDPIVKAYGKPSATYLRQRGRYVWACQLWAYRRGKLPVATLERCVVYGLAHPNAPKPTGPAS